MEYQYFATFTPDPDDGILVTFEDVPEAITHGRNPVEALAMGREALGLALLGRLEMGRDLPKPESTSGVLIAVDPIDALQAAVIVAFRASGYSAAKLAHHMGKRKKKVRRLLDPNKLSRFSSLAAALATLGHCIVIEVRRDG